MFHVGVAVNSKRTINEARSKKIWPQFFGSCQKCGMKCQLLIEGEIYDRHPQLKDFAMNRVTALMALLLSGIALMVSGCGNSVFPPPVDVSYRSSLFGIGKVVVITNTSGHHLYNVKVIGRNFKQVSSASVKATDHLAPGGVVEVGFLTFGSWTPRPGETIEVYADNYALPKPSIIPN
jgi:hypothetical protein